MIHMQHGFPNCSKHISPMDLYLVESPCTKKKNRSFSLSPKCSLHFKFQISPNLHELGQGGSYEGYRNSKKPAFVLTSRSKSLHLSQMHDFDSPGHVSALQSNKDPTNKCNFRVKMRILCHPNKYTLGAIFWRFAMDCIGIFAAKLI